MSKKVRMFFVVILVAMMVSVIWLAYKSYAPEVVETVEPTATVVTTREVVKEIVELDATSTTQSREVEESTSPTPKPTITPLPPTPTHTPNCIVGYFSDKAIEEECNYEDIEINVAFTSQLRATVWDDKETAIYEPVTWLHGSFDNASREAKFKIKVHLDNNIGDNNLPLGVEFGPDYKTWAIDVTGSEEMMTDNGDFVTNTFTVLGYGQVVEILTESQHDSNKESDSIQEYVTVIEINGIPALVWLKPEENYGFDRASVALYVGLTGCGEGGSCLANFTQVNLNDKNSLYIWSNGTHGMLTTVPTKNIKVYIDWETYLIGIPRQYLSK